MAAGEVLDRRCGDVAGYGEDVDEVHLEGVAGFFAYFEGGGGGGGGQDDVAVVEGGVEILFYRGA